ncbi:hypothetical protein GobsT_61830 [Gemmata obscuriglobus]|uniref:hypothetical protein n=1 Tax=Gemmata obscuriglobus TaxID=114 RepID=UPI00016C4728|nr:hypothetical protein [Gemmata obscuriglobus]QEG31362.1 hypothetical protein GobsT_61830 [Gemmata obscuriglobus]VTS10702.1 unnamed protein product [Gemmata obscuriglobus UQM 2246]
MGKVVSGVLVLVGVALFARGGFDAWLFLVTEAWERPDVARGLGGAAALAVGTYGLVRGGRAEVADELRRRNVALELEVLALSAELGRRPPPTGVGAAPGAEPSKGT